MELTITGKTFQCNKGDIFHLTIKDASNTRYNMIGHCSPGFPHNTHYEIGAYKGPLTAQLTIKANKTPHTKIAWTTNNKPKAIEIALSDTEGTTNISHLIAWVK